MGAVRTNVAQSATSVTLLEAGQRFGYKVFNDSAADLYIAEGDDPDTTASSTDFTCKVAAGGYYESTWSFDGAVYGIWSGAGAGAARITDVEWTPGMRSSS